MKQKRRIIKREEFEREHPEHKQDENPVGRHHPRHPKKPGDKHGEEGRNQNYRSTWDRKDHL